MRKSAWATLLSILLITAGPGLAQDTSREGMRSLDGQVQEIKSDVLGIAKDLSLLEERLLYPSGTQLAVFVELGSGEAFRLDAVQIEIDGELAMHHIYSFKELEALQSGGVQRLYTGNVPTGSHELTVYVNGKLKGGDDFSTTRSFSFTKDVEPKLLGLTLAGNVGEAAIELGDW